jgi:sugar phosphate isomerase/epimerase
MPYPSLPRSYKGMFPFKVSTTSYIYPDHIVPNVTMLAPFVDEIELVLFESKGQDNFPGEEEIRVLCDFSRDQKVGFNIHLPIDIFLGERNEDVRERGVFTVRKLIEKTLCVNPSVYTLHFDPRNETGNPETDIELWQKRIIRSAGEILECGIDPARISIETLGYPFEWVDAAIKKFGFSVCLDIGHVLISNQDLKLHLERFLPGASLVHLHGVQNGTDHLAVDRLPEPFSEPILSHLRNYHGIVSIEVFSFDDLQRSLAFLEGKWPKA